MRQTDCVGRRLDRWRRDVGRWGRNPMSDMKRRAFITLRGSVAARTQQAAMPVVGCLGSTSMEANMPFGAAFRQGLK
jgi:hypothetical protein